MQRLGDYVPAIGRVAIALKAAKLHKGATRLRVDDIDTPAIRPNEVLIRVRAAGVCHTDLHFLNGSIPITAR